MAVPVSDLRHAFRLIGEATKDPASAITRQILLELGNLIGADNVEYFTLREQDRAGLRYVAIREVIEPPGSDEVFRRHPGQNPLSAFRWGPEHGALRLMTISSPRALRRLDIYPVYYEWHQITDQLKIWLDRTPETATCISLDRTEGKFTERDAALLEFLQPHLVRLHWAGVTPQPRFEGVTLTRREAQIIGHLLAGLTNAEIGERLFIAPATVRKHLEQAYAKMGINGRHEAVEFIAGVGAPDALSLETT
jgi:DNA-binding CsgD family transcriptional regulator